MSRFLACAIFGIVCLQAAEPRFSGVWEGQMNEQPAVQLTLSEKDGRVSGSIVFYLQKRGEDGKWHVTAGETGGGAIVVPEVHGNLLTFEVRHHKSHGSKEYGPNKKFILEWIGEGQARFREPEGKAGEGLRMVRKTG